MIDRLVDLFLHLDTHLGDMIATYGLLVYAILFLIIFLETGVVVTPFLPGDSLLFAAGTFAAFGSLNPYVLFLLLTIAAILGDTLNYHIGRFVGPKVFKKESRWFKREYLQQTEEFYEKYGSKTIILARFIPIVRTFAPFVAGIGKMQYKRFLLFNVVGAIAWVGGFVFAGYYFGTMHVVQDNFSFVVLAIIALSFVPALIELFKHQRRKRAIKKKPLH
jgi:membrane-associated protein